MKRHLMIITAFFLLTALLFSGCADEKKALSFDEAMSFCDVQKGIVCVAYDFADIDSYTEDCVKRDIPLSFVSASVEKVTYYLVWSKENSIFEGYTVTELCIEDISSQYNNMLFKAGDTVLVRDHYYFGFKDEESYISFVTENKDKSLNTVDKIMEADSFETELKLFKDKEYVLHIWENEMPLKEGETYTMGLYPYDIGSEYCRCDCVDTIGEGSRIEEYESLYGLDFSDGYKSLSAEIKALFTN